MLICVIPNSIESSYSVGNSFCGKNSKYDTMVARLFITDNE